MWSETDDESISLLSQLKLTQPDKYKKLRERFTMPTMTSVPASKQASFSDTEVFFKNFIDVSFNLTAAIVYIAAAEVIG